jgi:hypothetical protein
LSQFDSGLAIGIILGKKMGGGGGSGDCDQGKLDIELAIYDNGGYVDKVGAVPTFEELVAGVYTILEGFPLRVFTLSDNVPTSSRLTTDDLIVIFNDIINLNLDDDISASATITDEISIVLI